MTTILDLIEGLEELKATAQQYVDTLLEQQTPPIPTIDDYEQRIVAFSRVVKILLGPDYNPDSDIS